MAVDRVSFATETTLDGRKLVGVAHAFGQKTWRGRQWEEFDAHSLDAALATSDVRAFHDHDRGRLLGRLSSGTLRLGIEDGVLKYEIDLPDTTYANDLRVLVERGDITGSSFGVIPGEFEWRKGPNGKPLRYHTSVRELVDVSPVATPAFEGTSVMLNSRGFGEESQASQLARARARARSKE